MAPLHESVSPLKYGGTERVVSFLTEELVRQVSGACSSQAWAAGAPLMRLQACLGMALDASGGRLTFDRPLLPEHFDALDLTGLHVGDAVVDVAVHRHRNGAGIDVRLREGKLRIFVHH